MPNKLSQFWQELKRRKVIHVITVYAGAAFVIIELINNISEPLRLPEWTPTLVIMILLVGFPLAVVFSWIFDVTPEGIEKTKPLEDHQNGEQVKVSGSWRIATYISIVIIIGLILINVLTGKKGPRIDESLTKSIAVLVFQNLSGDDSQEYICVGLTDEIISNLFKVASFDEVRSLTSVRPYQDSEQSIKEIAQELQVNYILEGTYKKMGEELKITAQLIEPESDNHIWLRDYELPYNEVPGIPGEIALQIANNLKAFISEDVQQSIDRMPTDNIKAYEYLQQAMNAGEWSDTVEQGIELAEKAIALDPDYADAYAWIGRIILFQCFYGGVSDMQTVVWKAERYINKAIEIDPFNISANWGIAAINFLAKWDFIKAYEIGTKYESFFRSDSILIGGLRLFYLEMGMYDEVLSLVSEGSYTAIRAYIMSGDTAYARELFRRRNVFEVTLPEWSEFYIYFHEYDSALYCFESMMADGLQSLSVPRFQAEMAVAYNKTGHVDKARSLVGDIIQRSDTTASQSPAFFLGWYYSWIGEPDSAFYWLEKAVENRSAEIPWLKVDPAFNSLKDDPRYWNLYELSGHKAFDDYMADKSE